MKRLQKFPKSRRRCPTHNRLLVRHAVVFGGQIVGHCWDCPAKLTGKEWARQYGHGAGFKVARHATCFYHEHEGVY